MKNLFYHSIKLLSLFACFFLFTLRISADEQEPKDCVSIERMKLLYVLGTDELILKFVSHPKSIAYFQDEFQKRNEEILKMVPLIKEVAKNYPEDKFANWQQNYFEGIAGLIENLPMREVVFPFLMCGIGDLSSIEENELKYIQYLQVGLFKDYICREVLESWGNDVLKDLNHYSNQSTLPFFSKIIKPLLNSIKSKNGDIENLISMYGNDSPEEEFSTQQKTKLSKIFDSYISFESVKDKAKKGNQIEKLKKKINKLSQKQDRKIEEETDDFMMDFDPIVNIDTESILQDLTESTNEMNASSALNEMIEIFRDNISDCAPKEKIIDLFFEVICEEFPENSEFFQEILQNGNICKNQMISN